MVRHSKARGSATTVEAVVVMTMAEDGEDPKHVPAALTTSTGRQHQETPWKGRAPVTEQERRLSVVIMVSIDDPLHCKLEDGASWGWLDPDSGL
ncbi:hypothetical protein AtubIFM57143_010982 [Aspergillus tubingensis]|nr:hypothetical protein AtubIFM57143_010982 [Aspergillus tubingensis]